MTGSGPGAALLVGVVPVLMPFWMVALILGIVGLGVLAGVVAVVVAIVILRAERKRRPGAGDNGPFGGKAGEP